MRAPTIRQTAPSNPPRGCPNRRFLAIVVGCILVSFAATASAEEGLGSLRSAGMGNNNVATNTGNGALFNNPAGLAGMTLYSLEAIYDVGFRSRTHRIGVAVADSKTNEVIAAGFAYTFSTSNGDDPPYEIRRREHDTRLALAVPIIPERLSIGVTGTHLKYNRGDGDEQEDAKGFSVDVGLMLRLAESAYLGFVAQDLAYVDGGTGRRILRTGAGAFLGPVHITGQWRVGIDGGADDVAQHAAGLGAEAQLDIAQFRIGYEHQFADHDNVLSVGLGIRHDTIGADLAFRQFFNDRTERMFGVSFSVFL